MSNVRVLVVDDSAAMRALFCDILDQARGIEVVGTARNADEAREKIAELRPHVLTLDVEMPGMTGMEFLAELMATRPMPVIMLSSVTQEGTGTAQKALELGAVDCFPKPLHTSQEEFTATVNRLGAIVLAAAKSASSAESQPGSLADFRPDGRIVVLAASTGSVEVMREVLAGFPPNCPPTIILLDAEPEVAERAIDRLRPAVACRIETMTGDSMLIEGTAFIAFDRNSHVVVENDYAPLAKLVARDPIAGFRPSADMLFASVARSGLPALGGLLAANHADGVRGLEAMAKTGATAFVQQADEVGPNQRIEAASRLGIALAEVSAKDVPEWILSQTSRADLAA